MSQSAPACENCTHFRADSWGSSGRCDIGPETGYFNRKTMTVKRERPRVLATSTCDKHLARLPAPDP